MSFNQTDLDNLEKAIASGARKVKQGDKEIEYNSLSEMLRARDLIRKALGLVTDKSTRIFTKFSKGLE